MFTWTLSPPHRHLPTTTALALQGGDLLVASPAAGGVVRIDRATSGSTVTPIPDPPLSLVVDGEAVWIVGAGDLDDDAQPEYDGTRHPVRWAEPTEADRARYRADMSAIGVDADGSMWPLVDDEAPLPTAADWEDLDDDGSELVDRSRRLYRRLVGAVGDNSGTVMTDGGTVWLLGYAAGEAETIRAAEVDAGAGIGDIVDPGLDTLVAIVDRIAVGLVRSGRTPWLVHDPAARRRVPVPDVNTDEVGTAGSTVWFVRADGRALVHVDVASGEVGDVSLAVDCAHRAPDPSPPAGLDLDRHEEAQLGLLRDSLLGGWTDEETAANQLAPAAQPATPTIRRTSTRAKGWSRYCG